MPAHNAVQQFGKGLKRNTLVKAATLPALTVKDVLRYKHVQATHADDAIALTLPAACAALEGVMLFISQGGAAAVTIIVTAGFAAAGASYDTLTLSVPGETAIVLCDGTSWWFVNTTVAA